MPDREAKCVSPNPEIPKKAEQKKSPVLWRDTGLISLAAYHGGSS